MASNTEEPVGLPFSKVYMRTSSLLPDSRRFRIRLGSLFSAFAERIPNLAGYLRKCGLDTWSHWNRFDFVKYIEDCPIGDALDSITFTYQWYVDPNAAYAGTAPKLATAWLHEVRRVLSEEALAYRIDDAGGVHPLVDPGFEFLRVSVLDGLGDPRYKAAKHYFEQALSAMEEQPPNTRSAVKHVFEAAENIFKVAASTHKDLTDLSIKSLLRPVVDAHYAKTDASQQSSAGKLMESFADWVNAGHTYRHARQDSEPHAPSIEFAVAYLSGGMTFIRWITAIDRKRAGS